MGTVDPSSTASVGGFPTRDGVERPDVGHGRKQIMGILGTIIIVIIVGLIAGFVARAVVPGRQSMGIGATILLGIIGSFVGGFLGYLLFKSDANDGFFQPAGIIGSIIGSIIVLLIWMAVKRRGGRTV
jgi:uncharacterized membrane protein YeaQ/YmgE (transglycosylase-associated protein family)